MGFYEMEEKENQMMIETMHRIYMNNVIKPYKKSEKIIDMHTHTNYSDGDLSPDELIRLAIDRRIGTLAITDHDTLMGIKNVNRNSKLIKDSGIKVINGIELTAKVDVGKMHILGYDIDLDNVDLNNKMGILRDNSINSVLSIMEQIKRDYGIIFKYEDIKSLVNANHNLGRPALAKLCIKYGYASSVKEAFDKYLIDAYNKTRSTTKGISYQECLDLITNILKMVSPKSKEEEYAYSYWTMIVHMDIKDINQLFYIYFPIISQNFFLTKDVLNGIDRKFKFYNLNISSNINIDSKYDIIYTSNLSEYLYKKNVALERYKDNLIHLLSPGGLIVSTNMIDDDISLLEEEIFKSDFQIDRIFNDNEEQIAYTYKLK